MENVKKRKITSILLCIVYIIVGIAFLIWPAKVQDLITIILGVIALAYGIYRLILYFTKDKFAAMVGNDLIIGIIFAILGVVVLILGRRLLTIVPVLFAIFIMLSSIVKIQRSFDIKRLGGSKWLSVFIMALISIVLAAIILVERHEAMNVLIRIIGIFMIIDGVTGIISIGFASSIYKSVNGTKRDNI